MQRDEQKSNPILSQIEILSEVGIFQYLDIPTIGNLRRVSLASLFFFSTLSSYDWQLRLVEDFGVKMETVTKFKETANTLGVEIDYQNIYKHFRQLSKKLSGWKRDYLWQRDYLYDPANHFQLLAIFANVSNGILLDYYVPKDEKDYLLIVSIQAGCVLTAENILRDENNPIRLKDMLYEAAIFSSVTTVQWLLDFKKEFNLTLYGTSLMDIVQSGNVAMVQFFVDRFDMNFNATHPRCAAESGNINMLQYVLSKININSNMMMELLFYAARSGNVAMLQFLLAIRKNVDLAPDQSTLKGAACSGNIAMLEYLLDNYHLEPTLETFRCAAGSGNVAMLKNLINRFDFKPDEKILESAAESGNVAMLEYLLAPENKYNLVPTLETLNNAAFSGSVAAVQYLIHRFHLRPDEETH